MVMCIDYHKSTSGLVVLVSEPVFEDVKNLGADESASTLKMQKYKFLVETPNLWLIISQYTGKIMLSINYLLFKSSYYI